MTTSNIDVVAEVRAALDMIDTSEKHSEVAQQTIAAMIISVATTKVSPLVDLDGLKRHISIEKNGPFITNIATLLLGKAPDWAAMDDKKTATKDRIVREKRRRAADTMRIRRSISLASVLVNLGYSASDYTKGHGFKVGCNHLLLDNESGVSIQMRNNASVWLNGNTFRILSGEDDKTIKASIARLIDVYNITALKRTRSAKGAAPKGSVSLSFTDLAKAGLTAMTAVRDNLTRDVILPLTDNTEAKAIDDTDFAALVEYQKMVRDLSKKLDNVVTRQTALRQKQAETNAKMEQAKRDKAA